MKTTWNGNGNGHAHAYSNGNGNGNGHGSASLTDRRALIFVHLPKTAGTTLNRLIEWEYSPWEMFTVDPYFIHWSNAHLRKLPVRRLSRYRVFKGHLPFGLHEALPQPATYVTVLREPVDRTISTYYFMKNYVLHPMYPKLKRTGWTLEQFVRNVPRNNIQCKYLANIDWDDTVTEPIYERARANLERHFSVVGLTERFEETLALMKLHFGWKLDQYLSFNRTSDRPARRKLPAATVELIEHYNRWDIELYRAGQELFEKQVAPYRKPVAEIVANLRRAQCTTRWDNVRQMTRATVVKAVNRLYSAL